MDSKAEPTVAKREFSVPQLSGPAWASGTVEVPLVANIPDPNAELSDARREKDISDLKQHVVQIEAVLAYVLICMVALVLATQSNRIMLVWATAIASLAGVGQVMRVRNPASQTRDRIINVTNGAAGGMGFGLAVDTAFGFMSLGLATALGGLLGAGLGALAPVSPTHKQSTAEDLVSIGSVPMNADIEIDGNFVGSTPSVVPVTVGTHTITIKKEGFADWTRTAKFSGGKVHLTAELHPVGFNK